MKPFEYFRIASVAQAMALLARYSERAAVLAGGSDLIGMMKDRLQGPKFKPPQYLIDIKGVKELNYITDQKSALKIGATTTITDIASSEMIDKKYPLLSQAARQVAVPQIRNVATLGGNLCQKPRCWYYRGALFKDCFRKGGSTCYALAGENQYNAIIGGHNCYMVYPSDLAPALTALNAKVEVASAKGNRLVPIEQFYVGPAKNVLRENILTSQEMLVGVEIPSPVATSKAIYLKIRERQAFDFAIVSVAVNLTIKDNIVTDSRIVFGGLAPYPLRSAKAETELKGKRLKDAICKSCEAALGGARPMSKNGYKVAAAKGALEAALASLI
ncbi:MAG: xanthine dehydrogenase family protein subunit M [Deltaproteobacteria bacterium]|nr:xanthine dehydrogenase family protein subunit M [Deltaproteobacteria bacterium]